MCFAPQADIVGGIVISAIGVDAIRHVNGRADHRMLAALPLLLGVHQIVEAFVWWGAVGRVSHDVGRTALWIYLVVAFVVLPVLVPLAVVVLEPNAQRRWHVAPFVALGAAIAAVLFVAMLRGPIGVTAKPYHLAYDIHLAHGGLVVVLYVLATCGALLFSGYRDVRIFGVVNLVAVSAIARTTTDGFASVWCAYAALAAGAIALHVRLDEPHPLAVA